MKSLVAFVFVYVFFLLPGMFVFEWILMYHSEWANCSEKLYELCNFVCGVQCETLLDNFRECN